MTLSTHHLELLKTTLSNNFVPHLPALLGNTKPENETNIKNLSRAFSAFALHKICEIPPADAAKSVIDDFDDYGIDAIYYHASEDTLYIIQSKLKASEQFHQDEANAFCQGIRKLIRQDFANFNQNVQDRITEIEDALESCSHIQLVIGHTGSGISQHAENALNELLASDDHGEERLNPKIIDYNASRVVEDLDSGNAYKTIDTKLSLEQCSKVDEPRITYFGLVFLMDLVKLHQGHGKALYEKNIRTFLGLKTDVNISIMATLSKNPEEFIYLNNGVTALCQEIEPKSTYKGRKKLKLKGFSVINGAQTIASAVMFVEKTGADISAAKVMLTLIKANSDGDFGKSVTRARNHQNPVHFSNFAALDDNQERLRREAAYLGVHYVYKAGDSTAPNDPLKIRIDEAAAALAILQVDPRFAVWLKKEPGRLLDTDSDQYKLIFKSDLSIYKLINAVRFYRYAQSRLLPEILSASGQERLVYKHGSYALVWVLAKRMIDSISNSVLLEEGSIESSLSVPFDEIRQKLWDVTQQELIDKGPLSLFRNQTHTVPLLKKLMVDYYGLVSDPVIQHKEQKHHKAQPYPEDLFKYLAAKAPKIEISE